MSETPLVGWKHYDWRKPARRCARCNRKARRGTVGLGALGHEREPEFRFVCDSCMREIEEQGAALQ